MQSKKPSYQHGKVVLVGGSLLIWSLIFLLFKNYGYTQTWELWKVPTESPPFSDFRLIPGSAETFRMGIEPSVRNPGDPHKRKFNYPTFWRFFFYTGITQADTVWISILMIALFFAGVSLFPDRLTAPGAVLMLSIIFSPASMLLYERGNVDLIVFFLCVVIVMAYVYSAYAAAALLIFGTVIKLFPFFGVSIFLKESKSKFILFSAVCLLALLTYIYITWDSVSASWNLTMRGKDISYGANVFLYRYGQSLSQFLAAWFDVSRIERLFRIGPTILAFILTFIAGIMGIRSKALIPASSERNLAAFRMGASIYIGTFLLGNNWDYRLAFLILVIPQLLQWTAPVARGSYRIVSVLTLIAIFITCWHFIVWYSPSLADIKEILFVLDEFFNWLLVAGFSFLLGVSMTDWAKEHLSSLSPSTTSVQAA
ncbi:MAG TPA: hypothetical protein VFZ43_13945 [Anaerolineales bacterium]